MSAAPLVVETEAGGSGGITYKGISNSSSYGSAPGLGSAWDMCGPSTTCCVFPDLNSTNAACVLVKRAEKEDTPLYVIVNQEAIMKVFAYPRRVNDCMLLVDLDLDNYANQGSKNLPTYFLTSYVDEALIIASGHSRAACTRHSSKKKAKKQRWQTRKKTRFSFLRRLDLDVPPQDLKYRVGVHRLPGAPPPATWHRGLAHVSESTFGGTPEDESYVTNSYVADTGSSSVLYPPKWELSDERSQVYDDTGTTRRRHLSLPSRPLATGHAVRVRRSVSPGPSTPSQRLHRSRVQSIELNDRQGDTLRRAAQRHTARGLYQDADDDVNYYRIPSPVTPATFTDSKYTSHALAPRRPQQRVIGAPRRRATSVPPRVRVALLSKNGTLSYPPSPPVDEFTDIPPVDLILYEPPMSVTAAVQPPDSRVLALKTSPPRNIRLVTMQDPAAERDDIRSESPPPMTTAVEPSLRPSGVEEPPASPAEPDRNDPVTCLQIWVLCVATAATLCIPYGTVILSYLLTPVRDMSNLTSGPSGFTTKPGTASTVVPTYTYTIPLNPSTVDPWNGVPQDCQIVPTVRDDTGQVNPHPSPTAAQSNLTGIFCLYNNTRFHRVGTSDFLPQNLPFSLCRNIVYWSFGVKDGVPISRVESFDRTYGLERLREVANKSGFPGVNILLTLGGYIEDYAQLSLLGKDTAALFRFVHRTMELMKSHFLNGVVIHWIEGEPLCGYAGVHAEQVFRAVFWRLRRIFRLNNFSGQLAAIVSASTTATAAVNAVHDIVDFVFVEARREWYLVNLDVKMCASWKRHVFTLVSSLRNSQSNKPKFCVVMSAAPLVVETEADGSGGITYKGISNSSSYGSAPGLGSAWDMCGPSNTCCVASELNSNNAGCILLKRAKKEDTPLYVIVDEATLRNVFESSSVVDDCMLLVDLDLDNYANLGSKNLPTYFLTSYVHLALRGRGYWYVGNKTKDCNKP
ncbi:hypothetical protein MTO96_008471 [Rhipicephalus appendiculatus]